MKLKKFFISKLQVMCACIFLLAFSALLTYSAAARTIHLGGLVVDAGTLKPVASAKLYDHHHNMLGITNENGYFTIDIDCTETGAVQFAIDIVKEGYKKFTDTENWGSLQDNSKQVMYFGVTEKTRKDVAFSKFTDGTITSNDLSYDNVLKGFSPVTKQKQFDNELAKAKAGNEDVLVKVNGNLYIVNDGGWIQLNSDADMVSVNDTKLVAATDLNAMVSRKNIKHMTPVEGGKAQFAIYTK